MAETTHKYTATLSDKVICFRRPKEGTVEKYKFTGKLTVEIKDGATSLSKHTAALAEAGVLLNGKNDTKTLLTGPDAKWTVTAVTDDKGNLTTKLNIDWDADNVWDTPLGSSLEMGGSFPVDGRSAEECG